jgi:hypothetical protein
MNVRVIAGIVFFSVAMTGVILANTFVTIMIGEIDRKREEGDGISYFGFAFPKMQRIFSEYRRRYPQGKLRIFAFVSCFFMVFGLIGAIVVLGYWN